VSVAVDLSALAERVDEYGPIAYLVTVSAEGLPHVVSVTVGWDGDEHQHLVVGAGRHTAANVGDHPTVTLLWPAPPGGAYGLIVDGQARVNGEGRRWTQRQKKLFTAPGPRRSQMRCNALGSSQARKPLSRVS